MSTKQFWKEFRAHRKLVSGPWCQRNHGNRTFQRKPPSWLATSTALSAPWRAAGVRQCRLEAIGSDHYPVISKGQSPLKISKSPSFPISHSPGNWLNSFKDWDLRESVVEKEGVPLLSSLQPTNSEEQMRVEADTGTLGLGWSWPQSLPIHSQTRRGSVFFCVLWKPLLVPWQKWLWRLGTMKSTDFPG